MSTAMAIAAAARVVAQLIDRRVALENFTAFQSMKTTVLSPEQIDGTDMSATIDVPPHINIFPYHVAMNAAYRNAFEPSRNAFGQPVTTPPLALDISFLVSTHSSLELLPEMLLGLAMQALSDVPQLTRERVRTLLAVNPLIDPPDPVLVALQRSGLADQLEILRIEPLNLNADEMQKLWTSIHSRCRPSFCYRISAVLIESENSAKSALPVRTFATAVVQSVRPFIDRIDPPNLLFQAAASQIALVGEELVQPGAVAVFSNGARRPLDAGSTPTRALVTLPAGLSAGIVGVELVRTIDIGAAPLKEVNESNLAIFLHRPVFALKGDGTPDITLNAGVLSIRLQPPPTTKQEIRLLLNDPVPSASSAGFTVAGVLGNIPATDPVTFKLAGVTPGSYMVRVRVDGAETPLTLDGNGAYTGPKITVV